MALLASEAHTSWLHLPHGYRGAQRARKSSVDTPALLVEEAGSRVVRGRSCRVDEVDLKQIERLSCSMPALESRHFPEQGKKAPNVRSSALAKAEDSQEEEE